MPLFIQYFLKFSISMALVYSFYQLFLRRLTFYNCNRWYLLGYVVLSFFIPFIDINPFVEKSALATTPIVDYIPAFNQYTSHSVSDTVSQNSSNLFTGWNLLLITVLTGSLLLAIRLCIQFLSLKKMRDQSTRINQSEIAIYHVEKSIIPFSFGKDIYINRHLHTEKELEDIILHEYVHVKQKHTIDIMMAELLCIFNWYNPFAWLIRNAIKQNLEFIADNQVLQTGLDKKNYQYHLLRVTGMPQYVIASNFNFSSLKKRITMMNKMKTAKVQLLRFLFLLPVIAVILLAFRNGNAYRKNESKIPVNVQEIKNDSIPAVQFDSLESKISNIDQDGPHVTVKLKNGKTETYNLQNESERKSYADKYGPLLEKWKKEQMKMEKEMEKMQSEQLLLQNEKLQELQNQQSQLLEKFQHENDLSKSANEELLELNKKNSENELQNYLQELGKPNKIYDSVFHGLQQEHLFLEQKMLLQKQWDYLNKMNQPLKTQDKQMLKDLRRGIQLQKQELQRNLKELQQKELEIEKQLKMMNKTS